MDCVLQDFYLFLLSLSSPNMITLIGLLTVVVATAITLFYSPDLSSPLPSWSYYLYFIFILLILIFCHSIGSAVWIYSSLDAIDGKHARRTGQCGPLGELFDHGCDAINISVYRRPIIYILSFCSL